MSETGPYTTPSGTKYWVRDASNVASTYIGFDIDSDPEPDIWILYLTYISSPGVSDEDKEHVTDTVESLQIIQVLANEIPAPSGPNILRNPYYQRRNHIRLARIDRNRTEFFGTIGGIPDGPALISGITISGIVLPAETLTLIEPPVWDGTETSSDWIWELNGTGVAGQVNSIVVPGSVVDGDVYRVVATATNADGTSVRNSNSLRANIKAPNNTVVPVISGQAVTGATLTLTTLPEWDNEDTSVWVWQKDGVDIAGSTDQTTLVLGTVNAGEQYRVKASATGLGGTSTVYSNSLIGEELPLPAPVWSIQPAISPDPSTGGDILTLTTGTASDTDTYTVAVFTVAGVNKIGELSGTGPWTWQSANDDDGAVVFQVRAANADASTLSNVINSTITADDADLSVENIDDEIVIFTDENGDLTIEIEEGIYQGIYTTRWDGVQLTTAMVVANPTCFLRPAVAGIATEGQTLTATPGLWVYDGADPGDQTWDWVNSSDGSTGETDLEYVIKTEDVGDRLKVTEAFAGIFVDSLETEIVDTGTPPYPDEFEVGDWTLATGSTATLNSLLVTIVNMPNDNGQPITAVAYDVGGDNVWRDLGIIGVGSTEITMEFPLLPYDIRLRSSNGAGASGPSDTKTENAGAGVPSAPVDWDPATGTSAAEINIVITTLPDANGSAITDFEYEVDGDGTWVSLGVNVEGTYPILMPEAGVEYSFSLRAINDVGEGSAAAPEVAESGAGDGAFNPEDGLTLSRTHAEGAVIPVDVFVAGEPCVWAADFVGLDVSIGGTGLEVGGGSGSQGAGYYCTTQGEFYFLCGDGASPTGGPANQALLTCTGDDRPQGDGTLVVEYIGSTAAPQVPEIRAWWNGLRVNGVVKVAENALNWSAPSLGGWMNRSGLYPGDMPGQAMTYTSVSALRQYNNQTVQDQPPPVGDDPEDGLTLTVAYAEFNNNIITAYNAVDDQVDVEAPAVMAFDITGLTTAEGYAYEFGATGIGAAVYFDTVGDLVIRCGAGGSGFASSRTTALVIANADAPSGDGTLVVEFIGDDAGNLPRIRVWWNGTRLAGTDYLAFNDEQWAGTDPGGFMLDSGSHVSDLPAVPMTYTTVSDLRYYRNQTVNL